MALTAHPEATDGPTPSWLSHAVVLTLGTFAVGTDAFVVAGILPQISTSLHVSVGAAGQLVTVFALAYALSAPIVGALTAGWSRRATLLAALATFVVGNALTALAPTYVSVLGSRVVAGVGAALYTANASATAARLAGPARRGRAISVVMLGGTSALVLGTPIGTAVGQAIGWRATLWLVAALGAIAACAVALRLPALAAADATSGLPALRRLAGPVRDRRVRLLLAATFTAFVGIFVPFTYISAIYAPATKAGGPGLALLLMVFGVASTVGNLAAGALSDRIGPQRVILTATLSLTVLFGALPFLRDGDPLWVVPPTVAMTGLLSYAVTTPQQHRLIALAPDAGPIVTSLYQSVLYLAVSTSGVVGAAGLALGGASCLGPIGALFALLAAALTAYQARRSRPTTSQRRSTGREP